MLLLVISIMASKNVYSQIREQVVGTVISNEVNNLTNFDLNYKFHINDSIILDSLNFSLPNNIIINSYSNIQNQQYINGDSISLTVNVSHTDTSNLSFYPDDLFLTIHYSSMNSTKNDYRVKAKLYFTPYNTVEIWNITDFTSLPRRWYHSSDNPTAKRVYLSQSEIPQSNILNMSLYERDSSNWNDWWVDDFREIEIDGLPYAVLMKPIPVDSLEYYSMLGDGKKATTKLGTNYSGTITGKITARVRTGGNHNPSDLGFNIIGLSGLKVRLREKDVEGYDYFGVDITDDDGTFEIQYNKTQYLEGGEIELYLEILAEDGGIYEINTANHWNTTIKDKKFIGNYGTNANITYNLRLDEQLNMPDAYAPIHFTTNIYEYFSQNNVQISNRVRFRIGDFWFWQNYGDFANNYTSMGGLYPPTICLKHAIESGLNEETVRHEFGHVIMYKLQGNNIKIPYGVEGVNGHSWSNENTGLLAWIEGWANAIQMIMDAADYVEHLTNNQINDPEFGGEYIYTSNYENREEKNINNGFCSEYYIACAIYDLWDGSGKGLPNSLIPGNLYVHSYNDANNWNDTNWNDTEIDDVEFSLSQICAPLQTINGNNLDNLRHIGHYLEKFIVNLDCESKAKVSKTFRQNKILWDIDSYNNEVSVNGLTTDFLCDDINKHETGYFRMEYPLNTLIQTWTDIYSISLPNYRRHSHYFNACPNISLAITDNYWIGYNLDGTLNGQNNIYLNSQDAQCNNATIGVFYTCGGVDLIIRNGKIELGAIDGSKTAELEINNGSVLDIGSGFGKIVVNTGSVLRIKDGGTLIINDEGILEIYGTGQVIIEEGGQIIYNNGSIIELNSSNSILEIFGNLHIGQNAHFTFTGNGYIKFSNPGPDNTYNITAGTGASMLFSGNGQSHKVLEIQQNTVHLPKLSSLTFQNCKIEMGYEKRMQTDHSYPVTFNNVKVTSTTGAHNNHRSFLFIGQSNVTINNSIFEYGCYGLYGNLTWADGAALFITNSTFRRNTQGINIYGKGLNLTNCNVVNNTNYGIYCDGMSFVSDFTDCNISNNGSGIYYLGSNGAHINMEDVFIQSNNTDGVITNGAFDVNMECVDINGNRYGVRTSNGTMIKPYACDLSNNITTIYLNYGGVSLYKKYNQLQAMNDNYTLYGRTPAIRPIRAEHNRWESNHNATPVYLDNYYLRTYQGNKPPMPVEVWDSNPLSIACHFLPPILIRTSSEYILEETTNNNLPTVTISEQTMPLDEAVSYLQQQSKNINSETAFLTIIEEYSNLILSCNAWTDSDNSEVKHYMDIAYSDLHSIISDFYSFINNDKDNQSFINGIEKIILLNENLVANPNLSYTDYYEYSLDIPLLYRIIGNYDDAISCLENLLYDFSNEQNQSEMEHIQTWLCKINAEKAAYEGLINIDEFFIAIEDCENCYSTKKTQQNIIGYDDEVYDDSFNNKELSIENSFEIIPNPNQGNFKIKLLTSSNNCEIRIINSVGQTVKRLTSIKERLNEINITGLKTGYYKVVYIQDNKIIDTQTVIVK